MNGRTRMSGRLIASGRALAGVSQAHFAAAAGLDVDTLSQLEAGGSAWLRSTAQIEAIKRGFDHFGLLIVEESDGLGAGVRLNFTRADVRQIMRLENEGGIIGSDDSP